VFVSVAAFLAAAYFDTAHIYHSCKFAGAAKLRARGAVTPLTPSRCVLIVLLLQRGVVTMLLCICCTAKIVVTVWSRTCSELCTKTMCHAPRMCSDPKDGAKYTCHWVTVSPVWCYYTLYSFVRSFVRSCVRLFVCSFIHSFSVAR